ncbi:helix-turn-helix domain-containing protein [Actinoplanes sp. NPDC051470]|uniref:TetR/AcrR family transcriptional regulator n=1 Tax=Actinoplanes sp. NPDC051470 TaxID=3157224 RepID=UPI003426092A
MSSQNGDLTARARIRDAAIELFAERGVGPATIRDIAERAGVSSGLLRHHFGSKDGLREACDEYAMAKMAELRERLLGPNGMMEPAVLAAMHPTAMLLQSYLVRSMMDGTSSVLFDSAMESGRTWLHNADFHPSDPEGYLAVLIAMKIGIFLMRDQISEVLGEDMMSPTGHRRMLRASIEIFSLPMLTPEQGERALKALDSLIPTEEQS